MRVSFPDGDFTGVMAKNFPRTFSEGRRFGNDPPVDSPQRVVLDMDSTEIPVYGQQEQSAYNGHLESTCSHPLLLFNRDGDCLAEKLRPGNVHPMGRWSSAA